MNETELLEEMRHTNRILQSTLLWTRIAAVFLAAILAVVLLCLNGVSRGIQEISQAIGDIDFSPVTEQLAKLDMDAVNGTLQSLEKKIDQVDMQVLNDAVAKLNLAVEAMQSASETLKSWGENVSRGLAGLFGA